MVDDGATARRRRSPGDPEATRENVGDDATNEPVAVGARGLLARLVRRAVAPEASEELQAATTTRIFLYFCVLVSASYVAFYLWYDPSGLTFVLAVNAIAAAVYGGGLVALRYGEQLAASLIALGMATVQILLCAGNVGSSVGFHLYLLAAGQLVFMVFTDCQRVFRWFFLGTAASAFVFCQVFLDADRASYHFASATRTALFSVNAIGAGFVMFILAALAHLRGEEAQSDARASAVRAEYLANTDVLTGLANRRPAMIELERLSGPDSGAFCIAIADLDGFKDLNDTYGHECGDVILSAVGRALREGVRVTDLVGRWGGEEFIAILPGTAIEDAVPLMERLRASVADLRVKCGGHSHTITASFGVADGDGEVAAFRVVKRADDAMYDAKKAGRNAVRARPLVWRGGAPETVDTSTRSLRVRGAES